MYNRLEAMFSGCICPWLPMPGTEEAGKSTFIKQMITVYGAKGYSERERTEFKMFIYCRVFTDIQILIKAMEALKIPYENPTNEVHCTCKVCNITVYVAVKSISCHVLAYKFCDFCLVIVSLLI